MGRKCVYLIRSTYFYDARGCPVVDRSGAPTMTDEDHVSRSAAEGLAQQVRADFEWVRGGG